MASRRRSPRVLWLPQDQANGLGNGTVYQRSELIVSGPTGSFTVLEIPLVIDQAEDALLPTTTLSDIGNSGYRLRRIVGKIWVAAVPVVGDTPVAVAITAGIIVRATGDNPNSLAFLTGNADTLSPSQVANTEDPWVWRRSWLIGNQLATGAPGFPVPFPPLGFGGQYGGNNDGPHVDQKTARLVGHEQRLFLNISSTVVIPGDDPQAQGELRTFILTDLRVLGSLRTTTGNRRNASR